MIATARKTLYHSELRTRSEHGPVRIQVLEEPRESKYAGREPYCLVKVEGEDAGRYYAIENPEIFAQLQSLPRNQWLSVTALGSREAAVLEVADHEPPATAPVVNRIAKDIQETAKAHAPASIAGSYWQCLRMAKSMVGAFEKEFGHEPSEAERAIATTLFIEQCRSGRPLST
jgi:hypothetical protein